MLHCSCRDDRTKTPRNHAHIPTSFFFPHTQPFLEHIIAGASLSSTDVEAAFDRILAGADPVQVNIKHVIYCRGLLLVVVCDTM